MIISVAFLFSFYIHIIFILRMQNACYSINSLCFLGWLQVVPRFSGLKAVSFGQQRFAFPSFQSSHGTSGALKVVCVVWFLFPRFPRMQWFYKCQGAHWKYFGNASHK